MDNASLSAASEDPSDTSWSVELRSQTATVRKTVVRRWTAVSVLVGLSVAGYLGLFVAIDTYLKGSL